MDDIVWIREEPPAPNGGSQSTVSGSIAVEPISVTLSSQRDSNYSVEIPVIIGVRSTEYPASKQQWEPPEEKQKLNDEKRVSFSIPESYPSGIEASSANLSKEHNEQGGFKITVSYPTATEDKPTDNSLQENPKQPDQKAPNELGKLPFIGETSSPGSGSSGNDSLAQKQSDEKAREDVMQSNEPKSFKITVSYPSDSDAKCTEDSAIKQVEQLGQNDPKDFEKRVFVNEASIPDSTSPVVSSVQKQFDGKSQEATAQNSEPKGFRITVSYPSASEAKSTENSAVKQPDQDAPKNLEKRPVVSETSSPSSTLPAVGSSTHEQFDDKSQKSVEQNEEQEGASIAASYPTAFGAKSMEDSVVKQSEQPYQSALKEREKEALTSDKSCMDSTSPVDSLIQQRPEGNVHETAKQNSEQKIFNTTLSSPDSLLPLDGAPVEVQVFDSTCSMPPSSTIAPVPLNSCDSASDMAKKSSVIDLGTDFTTLESKDEADKEQEENRTVDSKRVEAPPQSKYNDIENSEDAFDISEYERKLNETTEETKDLVNKLCDASQKLSQNTQCIANDIAAQRKVLFEDVYKTIEDIEQLPPPPELPTGGLARNVESLIIGNGVLKFVTGCIVLPNGSIVVTDEDKGIVLFDIQGNILKTITNKKWRKPRSPVCHKEHILMLVDMEETKGDWSRYIVKFTLDLEFVARIEGPKWMRNKTIISERLSIAHTDYIYFSVCGEIFSALYELTPVGQWTELQYRHSEHYVDMLAFAVIGPITQILAVEGSKGYVLQFSVRESEVVDRRRLAICERPGALARDEAGRLFIANRASTSIQLVDTVRWSAARNVALTDSLVPHFSASWGLLAIPIKGAVRLQRYSFRLGYKQNNE